jgi:hypothetical protein
VSPGVFVPQAAGAQREHGHGDGGIPGAGVGDGHGIRKAAWISATLTTAPAS